MLAAISSYAQVQVSGKVVDETGTGMPGVNIIEKGTTNGATTDANGSYNILVTSNQSVLVFSFIGYSNQEIVVGDRTSIDVSLTVNAESLAEIVVVGYGTQKKVDLTGAVASVDLRSFQQTPNTNLGQFMQGTVPGLNVGVATSSGGTPPISIRGRVSLNGNQNVLIVLDGIQYNGSLSSINPDDIASIDVLKDASSTAVYGAQAANGVILITSKRGTAGKAPTISFKSIFTSQEPTVKDFVPLDRAGYLKGLTEAFYTQSYTAASGYTTLDPAFDVATVADASMKVGAALKDNNFNWWKAGTTKGKIQENILTMSGATDRVNYLLSGAFVDQKGWIINDKFARKTVRANLEVKPIDWMKIGLVSSGSFVNQDGAEPSLESLVRTSPLLVPFDANGNLIQSPTNTIELNPMITYYVTDVERHNYLFAKIYTEIEFPFLKGLKYTLNYGNNYRTDKHYYASKYDAGASGRAYKDDQEYYDYTLDNILSYNNSFGKHEIGATLLYGAIERKFNGTFAEGTGFARLNLSYNSLQQANTQKVSSSAWSEALLYQMARVNYKFNNRYLLTATVRQDGFSGFSKNNKTAIFPSFSGAWILSEEGFIKNINIINQLKLRVGYGQIGNQTGRYSSLASLRNNPLTVTDITQNPTDVPGTAYIYGSGPTAFGQRVGTLGNSDLKWERTTGLNLGLDFTILAGRTSGSLEFYNNNTRDLLFSVQIPSASGFDNIFTNLGQINNRGFEARIVQDILNKGDLNWTTTFVFAGNKNKIVHLTGQDLNADGKEDDLISSNLFIGKSIKAIYDFKADGIYNLTDTPLPGFPIGSVKAVDKNNDGIISSATLIDDRMFLGKQDPSYRFSIQNNINYKGIGFSFFINSVQGVNGAYSGINRPFANNTPQYWREDNTIRWNDFKGMDYWSPSNPNGKYPRVINGVHPVVTPGQYQNRSFVRLQDVSLSYDLAKTLLKKLNTKNFSVFVSGKNLFTWTKWDGWDPESVDNNGNPTGLVAGGRPVLRAYSVGISLTY